MAVLQTINECYLEEEWIRIFTDGSSNPGTGETGAGYYSVYFEGRLAVGAPLSNYDGEIAAVEAAAGEQAGMRPQTKVVFLVDSQTAIRSLLTNSDTGCASTAGCRRLLDGVGWEGFFSGNLAMWVSPAMRGLMP